MSKNVRSFLLLMLLIIILLLIYQSTFFDNSLLINYSIVVIIVLVILPIIYFIFINKKTGHVKHREKLFNSLVKNSNTVYIMMNASTKKIVYLTGNVEEVLGLKTNDKTDEQLVFEMLNISIIKSELNHWNEKDEYVSQMVLYDNPSYNHQMWIRLKIYPYKEKKETYYIIQVIDATKEHDRQHLLITQAGDIKLRENQLNQITSSIYDVEIDVNTALDQYSIKYFKNDKKYFGSEREGIYSKDLDAIALEYINENDRESFIQALSLDNLKKHFKKFQYDSRTIRYRIGNEDKNNIWLESTIFFLSNKQHNHVSILTKNVTEDAESIRMQNIVLQNALNDARLADQSKTELISTISHDIRIPLTTIMGLSESILRKNIDSEVKEDITNIKDSSNEMLSIIDGLLDPTKIEKKLIDKEQKEYRVEKLCSKIASTAQEYIGNKNIKINLTMDNNLPIVLKGDSKRLRQAVLGFLNNSIKYTNEGNIDLIFRGEKKDKYFDLIIEINDNSYGIDPNKLNQLLSQTNNDIGSSKKIIEALGGDVSIDSVLDKYTKILISIKQIIVEDNKVRELMSKNQNVEEFDLTGKKVLVVDDNKLNLKVTKRLLEPYNISVTLLESGNECIDLITENLSFDLILLDQMMPGLNGLETFNKLKQIKNFNIPVVALTADAMIGQKEKYLNDGFDDYMSKPIQKEELNRVLRKFLK